MPAKPYRSKSRLILDLLSAIQSEAEPTVTRLLFRANLSHPRLKELLEELSKRGWIEVAEKDGQKMWSLTVDGARVIAELRRINGAMADFGLDL